MKPQEYITRIEPRFRTLLSMRELARESRDTLTSYERLKFNLAFSVIGLFFTKLFFNKFYVLTNQNHLIAFAIVRANLLCGLFVCKSQRRKGYGTLLLEYLTNTIPNLCLRTTKSSRPFYEKQGYFGGKLLSRYGKQKR